MSYLVKPIFTVVTLFLCSIEIYSISNHPLLLVVSFDAFRYNYFERNLTPEMVKLRSNGTYSEYMTSVFPSKTFPNHFSVGTGMYVDVHGVLDNKVFDSKLNKELEYGYDLFHYNKEIVPIWTLNERRDGHHSGCMMWPGSDLEYQGIMPNFFQTFDKNISWEVRVDTMISWFVDGFNPINLGMMYFEEPDYTMHTYGPDSPQVNEKLEQVNSIVKYLMDKIKEADLLGKLNVIMLSDHGAQAVPYTHIINLNKYLSNLTYSIYGVSPNLQIYPKPGKYNEVLSLLRTASKESGNFLALTKDEIFEQWHYRENDRCPPILLVANSSYVFNDVKIYDDKLGTVYNTTDLTNVTFGTHGYDPLSKNMRAFFMSFGPLIKRNHTVKPFVNIDLYPLFVKILDLELPELQVNGTSTFVKGILIEKVCHTNYRIYEYIIAGAIIVALCFTVVGSIIIVYFRRIENLKRKSSLLSYRVLVGSEESSQIAEGSKLLVTSDFEDDSPS